MPNVSSLECLECGDVAIERVLCGAVMDPRRTCEAGELSGPGTRLHADPALTSNAREVR